MINNTSYVDGIDRFLKSEAIITKTITKNVDMLIAKCSALSVSEMRYFDLVLA
jgi:hypothetical protein